MKSRGICATSLSTYDFSTLYTTLLHNLIKENFLDLIERTFKETLKKEGTLYMYLVCNDKKAFSLKQTIEGLVGMYVTPHRIFWIIFTSIRFGNKLYRQSVGIPMGTNCAPLVADFVFILLRKRFYDFDMSILLTSRYLDDLLNTDHRYI